MTALFGYAIHSAMHELAIAQKIIAAADKAAEKNGIKSVRILRLRLGRMAAAHKEQLEFGFATYAKGSRLENAKLEVEEVMVELECERCRMLFNDVRFEDHDFAHTVAHAPMAYIAPACPKCGSEGAKVVRGQEMELIDLEGE